MNQRNHGFKEGIIGGVCLVLAAIPSAFAQAPTPAPVVAAPATAPVVVVAPTPAPEPESGAPSSLTLGVVGNYSGVDIDSSNAIQNANLESKRRWGLGASASLDTPISGSPISLAIGAMYIQRKFELGNNTLRIERTVPTLFVPVEARLWIGNFLYAGAGVFGALRVGDQEDKLLTGSNTVFSFSSSQRDEFEYGFTGSAGLTFPVSGRTGITVEGRYLYGMNDAAKDSIYDEKIRDFAVTAGVRLGLK